MPIRPISLFLSGTCSSSSEEQVHSPNVTDARRLLSETFGITRVGELDDRNSQLGRASTSDARILTYVCPPRSSSRSREGSSHEVLGDGYVTETSERSLDPSRLYTRTTYCHFGLTAKGLWPTVTIGSRIIPHSSCTADTQACASRVGGDRRQRERRAGAPASWGPLRSILYGTGPVQVSRSSEPVGAIADPR